MEGQGNQELQTQTSWIPATPIKPISLRPQPICDEVQENEVNLEALSESDEFPPGFAPTTRNSVLGLATYSEEASFTTGEKRRLDNFEVGSFSGQSTSSNGGTWENSTISTTGVGGKGHLSYLLAAILGGTSDEFATTGSSYISFSNPSADNPWPSRSPAAFRDTEPEINLPGHPWLDGDGSYSAAHGGDGLANTHNYDLNLPPSTDQDAASYKSIPAFAPITPDKALRAEKRMAAGTLNVFRDERQILEQAMEGDRDATSVLRPEVCVHDKELQEPVIGSPSSTVSSLLKEKCNPEKGDIQYTSLDKTPRQKERRKKHRPKVVIEGKPKRPRKSTPKPADSTGRTTGKRKYVRRKGVENTPTSLGEVAEDSHDLQAPKPPKRSCRKALNFNIEEQQRGQTVVTQSASLPKLHVQDLQGTGNVQANLSEQFAQEFEVFLENGKNSELDGSTDPTDKGCITPEEQDTGVGLPNQSNHNPEKLKAHFTGTIMGGKGNTTDNECKTMSDIVSGVNLKAWGGCAEDNNCGTSTIFSVGEGNQLERELYPNEHGNCGRTNLIGVQYNSLEAYTRLSWIHFPIIHKKKRTEKAQHGISPIRDKEVQHYMRMHRQILEKTHPLTPEVTDWSSLPRTSLYGPATATEAKVEITDKHKTVGGLHECGQRGKLTRKRSRGPTRVRDFASLNRILECHKLQLYSTNEPADGSSQKPHSCIEALLAEQAKLSRKKRTKKKLSLVSSAYAGTLQQHPRRPVMSYNYWSNSIGSSGTQTELLWKQVLSIDAIVQQLEQLNIDAERDGLGNALACYDMSNQESNALVLYERNGTIVPFENSLGQMKKRRPRPKVDLDEETNRVWKLLLDNINSDGIDGTDEEKAKKWEEERRVFKGRADSFIARMRLVQGDRHFSPWKGSVVDSVIGVFLTQNVSDHLSSSAFMSLASRFPQKPHYEACSEEGSVAIIDEPDVHLLEMEYPTELSRKKLNQTACDQSSIIINDYEKNEETEVIKSEYVKNRTCTVNEPKRHMSTSFPSSQTTQIEVDEVQGDGKAESSSPISVISSQNSVESPPAQTAERTILSSEDLMHAFSKTNSLDDTPSFTELLHMAGSNGLQGVCTYKSKELELSDSKENATEKSREMENKERMQIDTSYAISVSRFLCNSQLPEVGFSEKSIKGIYSVQSPKDENEQLIAEETATNLSITDNITEGSEETSRHCIESNQPCNICEGGANSESRAASDPKAVPETEGQGETRTLQVENLSDFSRKQENTDKAKALEGVDQNSVEILQDPLGYSLTDKSNETNLTSVKTKSRGVGKEKKKEVDWDSLRRQAESNGQRRSRTPNTMDSVDWEAVRCTEANEIADAIKERGMNNVLAGRIKDFLNRLAREHGSVDLEWLRDVPPDKAKEYLLSFRGLGLKSVECVRLLTLHHLAFPVDTNVGRIAVRLGWVPLQPLPESLQLHLLELYPVLESIQQYLWPRLCKLDQGTLYELHYQMITFGKVFCTKSKPNCNACPMRGECKHFASAFASARLALPGPEEKGIVNVTERRVTAPNIGQMLSLPLPQAGENLEEQQQEARPGPSNCQPIIEEPATPEPDNEQIAENDMEDMLLYESDEIPTIKFNVEGFTQNLREYMQQNMDLQEDHMSKALVALTPDAASIPVPKLKNVSRLRTEHLVYEIPEGHPLMNGLDKLEADDPSKYLLAIWTPGETASSIQPPESRCSSKEFGILCNEITCFSCNSVREANSQIVRGTFLIPCRTAMRGSFPLNGTYFQVNEVFADHETSINPIDVPRELLWNLQRKTVYFGTSIPTIFKGLSTESIQHCFWRGYVCVRGFDRKTRAPRPLMARLHFPASKLPKTQARKDGNI